MARHQHLDGQSPAFTATRESPRHNLTSVNVGLFEDEPQGKKPRRRQPRETYPMLHERPSDSPTMSSQPLTTDEGPWEKTFPSDVPQTTSQVASMSVGTKMYPQKVRPSSRTGKRGVGSKEKAPIVL